MEILNDILVEIQSIRAENQQLKQVNQGFGKTIEELEKSISKIDIKPINKVQISSNSVWEHIEPNLNKYFSDIREEFNWLKEVSSKIPARVENVNKHEFKIFNGNWFAIWGAFYLVLFLIALYFIPATKAILNPSETSAIQRHLQFHIDRNPKTEAKYKNGE